MSGQTLSPRAQAEDDSNPPEVKRSHTEDVLSFQEISHLNDRKVALKDSHFTYLTQHPELRSILADFTAAVLLEKPMNIFPFAAEHFAALAHDAPAAGPPMLVRGPPVFVVAGAKRLRLLEMLNRRFPGTFMAPVMTTTRPPRRGERPGLTMNFATREMIAADVERGTYLETGPEADGDGEVIGTTLEAVTRIKAMGAVPLLHVSRVTPGRPRASFLSPHARGGVFRYERAVAARTCEKVHPPPCTVLVCDDAEAPEGAQFNFNTIIRDGNSDKVLDQLVATVEKYYPDRVQD